MITLFVALYSLLCLCTTGNTSDIKEPHVKTVKLGENVTMECNVSGNKDNVFWYRQRFGEMPQFLAKPYKDAKGYTFAKEFNDRRFSVTVNGSKFDLNINGSNKSDRGDYLCVNLDGTTPKFTSGTRLQFEGEEMKPCPTPGTLNKNTHSVTHQGSNSRDGEGKEIKPCSTPGTHDTAGNGKGDMNQTIALITSNIISVIVIVALVGVLLKQQGKGASSNNHQTPTNQADDKDVLNYAAVSFAKKPSSSRTSRDTSHQDVYAQVKIK